MLEDGTDKEWMAIVAERDATIERLQAELAEEHTHAAEMSKQFWAVDARANEAETQRDAAQREVETWKDSCESWENTAKIIFQQGKAEGVEQERQRYGGVTPKQAKRMAGHLPWCEGSECGAGIHNEAAVINLARLHASECLGYDACIQSRDDHSQNCPRFRASEERTNV